MLWFVALLLSGGVVYTVYRVLGRQRRYDRVMCKLSGGWEPVAMDIIGTEQVRVGAGSSVVAGGGGGSGSGSEGEATAVAAAAAAAAAGGGEKAGGVKEVKVVPPAAAAALETPSDHFGLVARFRFNREA